MRQGVVEFGNIFESKMIVSSFLFAKILFIKIAIRLTLGQNNEDSS